MKLLKLTIFPILILTLAPVSFSQDASEEKKEEIKLSASAKNEITYLEADLNNPETAAEDLPLIRTQIAKIYAEAGDSDNAIIHLKKAIELPGDADVSIYYTLGSLYMRTDQFTEAHATLTEAETTYPDSLDICRLQSFALRALEKWDAATENYAKFEKMFEEQTGRSLNHEFYFEFGQVTERKGDIEKAAQHFLHAQELIPPGQEHNEFRAQLLNYLGYMWLEKDVNLDVAGELVKKAAKLSPDSGAIADSVGWYYFKKGQYFEAMNELIRAEALIEEPDAVVLDHIAQTFYKIGKKTEAINYLNKAIDLEPKNKEFKQRLAEYRKTSEGTE